MKKPEKKLRTVWYAEAFVLSAVAAAFLSAPVSFLMNFGWDMGAGTYGVSFGILIVLTVTYMTLRYRAWNFELREDHLYLEHGVFMKVNSMVPYVRVQHIDTQRGVVERLVGLSKVVIYTAGSRGADVTVPGLLPEDADDMQEKLRYVAIESEDRDGV